LCVCGGVCVGVCVCVCVCAEGQTGRRFMTELGAQFLEFSFIVN